MQQDSQHTRRIGKPPADLLDSLAPHLVIGGIAIKVLDLAPQRVNLLPDRIDVRLPVAAIEMDSHDVHAGARKLQGGGFAESAAGAEDEGPGLFGHGGLTSISLSSP